MSVAIKKVLKDTKLLKTSAFVGGQWLSSTNRKSFDVLNPADGSVVSSVIRANENDVNDAVEHASAAWKPWSKTLAGERSEILHNWFDLMMENQEDLAQIMTAECGKPLAESRGEIVYAASFLKWFAEESRRIYGDTIPNVKHGQRILVMKQPIGVAAMITPWNFPSAMITRKAGPALAAGCTIVCKPSEDTPLSALALAELGERAGIPQGVFNVVTGDRSDSVAFGNVLSTHPAIRKLSFTGSTAVGKTLLKQCSSTMKKVSLEAGGNAPFIVFDDADLDNAVQGLLMAKFRNAGQTCVCANRIYVQDGVYDLFLDKLIDEVRKFKIGNGATDGVNIGPLINSKGVEKVKEHVNDAVQHGARIAYQLESDNDLVNNGENFFKPTVLADVTPSMRCSYEETFGPVAPLIRFKDESEVIQLANDTSAGLAAYFYTSDLGRSFRVTEALEYGMVGVNEGIISTEVAPFGGIKESGTGREGSKYGMDDYLEIKYALMGGI
eukprot:g8214.t1